MFTLKVDEYQATGNGEAKLIKTRNYIRLGCQSGTVFLQSGRYWYENGAEAAPLPDWVHAELTHIPAEQLKAIGFEQAEPKETRTCSKCSAEIAITKWSLHQQAHNKQELKAIKWQS
jgi:hypothetical protein